MAIVEYHGGPITHRYLMNKTKHDLASMYMELLRIRERDLADAQRWRAFESSARFKMMGSANFDHSAYPEVSVKPDVDPRDWLHFGLEVWDKHPSVEDEQGKHGRNLLMAYVEHRRALLFQP